MFRFPFSGRLDAIEQRLAKLEATGRERSAAQEAGSATRQYAERVLTRPSVAPLPSPVCQWCDEPAASGETECGKCGAVRPKPGDDPDLDDDDADLVVACERCGDVGASMESGLCQGCEGRRAGR